MLLDDLLNDGQAMRSLVGLLRRRSRPTAYAQLHESFLDHAALHEEQFTRSLGIGAERAEPKNDDQYVSGAFSAPLVGALAPVSEDQMPTKSKFARPSKGPGKTKKPARRVSASPRAASSPINKPSAATETHIESPASAMAVEILPQDRRIRKSPAGESDPGRRVSRSGAESKIGVA
jgi:hypothetical protein